MFSKISRYRKLPDIVAIDAKGRELKSKDVRLSPEVTGTFLHTVEEVDRLDHLSFKFYKQPRKWWRICDANPEFMSPQALLGKEPMVTHRFPLTYSGSEAQPPWANLMKQLSEMTGVEDLQIVDEAQVVPVDKIIIDGEEVTIYDENFQRAVIVTYNQMNVSTKDLANTIEAVGFVVAEPQNIGRVGKSIIIPPDAVG